MQTCSPKIDQLKLYNPKYKRYKSLYRQLRNTMTGGAGQHLIVFRSNTALDVFPDDPTVDRFFRQLPGVTNYSGIRNVDNLDDMIAQFIAFGLGPSSVVQIIIQAHGSPTTIEIGRDDVRVGTPLWDRFTRLFTDSVVPTLVATGSVFLHSCSVGRDPPGGQSLARQLSGMVHGHVLFAANGDVGMGDLIFKESEFSVVSYEVSADRVRHNYSVVQFLNGEVFDERRAYDAVMERHPAPVAERQVASLRQGADDASRYACIDNEVCLETPSGPFPSYDNCIANCFQPDQEQEKAKVLSLDARATVVINILVERGLDYLKKENRQALIHLMDANDIPKDGRNVLLKKAKDILNLDARATVVINTLVERGLDYLKKENRQALIHLMDANDIPKDSRNALLKKAKDILNS